MLLFCCSAQRVRDNVLVGTIWAVGHLLFVVLPMHCCNLWISAVAFLAAGCSRKIWGYVSKGSKNAF